MSGGWVITAVALKFTLASSDLADIVCALRSTNQFSTALKSLIISDSKRRTTVICRAGGSTWSVCSKAPELLQCLSEQWHFWGMEWVTNAQGGFLNPCLLCHSIWYPLNPTSWSLHQRGEGKSQEGVFNGGICDETWMKGRYQWTTNDDVNSRHFTCAISRRTKNCTRLFRAFTSANFGLSSVV